MKKCIFLIFVSLLSFVFTPVIGNALTIQYSGKTEEYKGSVFKLSVNGKYPSLPLAPLIFNDRAVVPVREVFEALGADVSYEEKTKCVDVSYKGNEITLYIDKTAAYINGKKANIPDGVAPKLINEVGKSAKTMVPVRFISESLKMNVEFKDDTIFITNEDYKKNEITQTPTTKPQTVKQPDKINVTDVSFKK